MNALRTIITGVVSIGSVLFGASSAWADEYSMSWGPEVGSVPPLLEAPDQSGRLRTLADLSGEQGLLLFLNRSADW